MEVYDENGNFIEAISGFTGSPVGGPPFSINPNKRMGWALGSTNGGSFNQLLQFYY